MNNRFVLRIFATFLLLVACTQDDASTETLSEQEEGIYTTTSQEEVLELFKNPNLNSTAFSASETSGNSSFVSVDIDKLTHEPLVNSDAMMTVIPATLSQAPNIYSRVLALDIEGEMQTAVFSMYSNSTDQSNGFNGHYVSYTLEGEPINAFRVEQDTIVARLLLPRENNITTTSNELFNINITTSTSGDACNCNFSPIPDCCFDDQLLEEVIIVASSGGIPVEQTFEPSNTASVDLDTVNNEPVSFLAGGGGNLSDPDEEEEQCPLGKVFDPILEICVTPCNSGFINDINGNCVPEPDCDTKSEDIKSTFTNVTDAVAEELSRVLNERGKDFGIDTKEELQHFLAQAGHESGGFSNLGVVENLNYTTASRIAAVWPSRFSLTDPNKLNPNDFVNDPEKLGNEVYSNRNGNGDAASGDGFKYRGRGIFQLTGKANYLEFQTFYNNKYNPDINIISSPGLLSTDNEISITSALWFYQKKVLNRIGVDSNTTVEEVTTIVNGGSTGIEDREDIHQQAQTSIDCIEN